MFLLFVVQQSASSPIGYTHVVRLAKDSYRCTAKSCKTLVHQGSGKQQQDSKLCFHKRVLWCALHTSSTDFTSLPPEDSICRFSTCDPKLHSGSRDNSKMMTIGNPFRKFAFQVKSCRNNECKALHQIWPVDKGNNDYVVHYFFLFSLSLLQ